MSEELVRVQVYLPKRLVERFEQEARARGLKLSSYLRSWIMERAKELLTEIQQPR